VIVWLVERRLRGRRWNSSLKHPPDRGRRWNRPNATKRGPECEEYHTTAALQGTGRGTAESPAGISDILRLSEPFGSSRPLGFLDKSVKLWNNDRYCGRILSTEASIEIRRTCRFYFSDSDHLM
jgi:hypothetical protein